MKHLPIGISSISTIIENDMVYIDKTESAYRLSASPGRYFLSRPRRFGKSLFVDTLKEILEGNKKLFKGLYIYDKWDWSKKFPVIKIDFAGGVIRNMEDMDNKLDAVMSIHERKFNITTKAKGNSNRFNELIMGVTEKTGEKAVILVDEYDKPLLDNIENPEMTIEVREGLKNFYSVIKEQDANLHLVFLTGVSKFSKVNIFSGINNLEDITLDKAYATICGYTQNDLETVFREHLGGTDWKKLREWYNGYNFLGEPVYNPFDILLFISKDKSYRNYWFETGTPTFLIKLFQKNRYFLPDLDSIEAGEELLSSFDVETLEPITLLYQTGYLTIKKEITKRDQLKYSLTYPNREVKQSLNKYFIHGYTMLTAEKGRYEDGTYDALISGDMPAFEQTVKRLFAGIPYRNFTNNDLLESEGYYASVLYAFFCAINCTVTPEDINNRGQADITVKLGNNIYVMEIKVVDSESEVAEGKNEAFVQIKERAYADKYLGLKDASVYEVGMIFSREARNLIAFGWEKRR